MESLAVTAVAARPVLPFRHVNRRGDAAYQPDMQRHHLLPRQLLRCASFVRLFDMLGSAAVGFDDFRRNGLLLPATDKAAMRTGLPLHRGPHHRYNEVVHARVGRIEAEHARLRGQDPAIARAGSLMRLGLLQRALRRSLMQPVTCSIYLNRKDPFRAGIDFTDLDAMADRLFSATG